MLHFNYEFLRPWSARKKILHSDVRPLQARLQDPSSWRSPPGPSTWTDRAGWAGQRGPQPSGFGPWCGPLATSGAALLAAVSFFGAGVDPMYTKKRDQKEPLSLNIYTSSICTAK